MSDLIAGGLAGEPINPRRSTAGFVIGIAFGVLAPLWFGFRGLAWAGLALITIVGVGGWLIGKGFGRPNTAWRRPRLTLAWLVLVVSITIALTPFWPTFAQGGFENWVTALPFRFAQQRGGTHLLTIVAVMLFLSAPANACVRGALTIAGTTWHRSEKRLRGGRIIGILERWLIFGLAAAGEPTAAALIVSAKSLLRFPGLGRVSRDSARGDDEPAEIDIVTEYFLLGSLLSWTLALAPVLLLG
ncbi:MAG: hypothetical protein HC897_18210 [Thermoanaerobaculia bacterium]|nr:hypothetical protein [Thermoanaerobaculia bacterium]